MCLSHPQRVQPSALPVVQNVDKLKAENFVGRRVHDCVRTSSVLGQHFRKQNGRLIEAAVHVAANQRDGGLV
jgi:hypothetical protein